jgi:Ca2+-binding EF-hand superfamily protein
LDNLRQACIEAEVNLTDSELKEMLKEADKNGDNQVDATEFIAIMLKTNLYS